MAIHVADLFYDRLFELDPSLEQHFPEDLSTQRPRFMNAVGAAVAALDDIEAMRPTLLDIGRRYLSQGIGPGHYAALGKALLWAFEQTLAEDFTPLVKEAWAALYADMSGTMGQAVSARDGHEPREHTQLAM